MRGGEESHKESGHNPPPPPPTSPAMNSEKINKNFFSYSFFVLLSSYYIHKFINDPLFKRNPDR